MISKADDAMAKYELARAAADAASERKREAIAVANVHLRNAGLATYDDLVGALQTMEMALIGYVQQNDITKNALAKARATLAAAGA